jgi:hypothetical protein
LTATRGIHSQIQAHHRLLFREIQRHVTDSDEHDEEGYITEDSEIRIKWSKRLLKNANKTGCTLFLYGNSHPRF